LPHATATSTSLPKWQPKIFAKTNETLLLQCKDRKKAGIAAKRHKKHKKVTKRLSESNPRYQDYRLKARVRVSAHFSRFLPRSFFAMFVLFLDRHSLGGVCCSYSRSLAQRRRFLIPTFLRLLCLFAAIPVLC
jgi:hypothetical protein